MGIKSVLCGVCTLLSVINGAQFRCKADGSTYYIQSDQMTKGNLALICGLPAETAFFLKEIATNNVEMADIEGRFQSAPNTEYVIVSATTAIIEASTRKWVQVGSLNDIEDLVVEYPTTIYEYGVLYSSVSPFHVLAHLYFVTNLFVLGRLPQIRS